MYPSSVLHGLRPTPTVIGSFQCSMISQPREEAPTGCFRTHRRMVDPRIRGAQPILDTRWRIGVVALVIYAPAGSLQVRENHSCKGEPMAPDFSASKERGNMVPVLIATRKATFLSR